MTQIFLNQGLGITGSSIGQLGFYGPKGQAGLGQGGESIYLNAMNGNLVFCQSDGFLAGSGLGLELTQSYNSLGEKGQNWCFNIQSHLIIKGKANSSDSTITRVDEDGHRSQFIFDATKGYYVAEKGGTARLSFSNNHWSYQEGASSTCFEYDESGLLTRLIDKDGHQLLFHYREGQLEKITDNSGKQSIEWTFEKGLLREICTLSEGKAVHHLHFEYDQLQRLRKVSRDLGEGKVYWTTYDYLADSNLITSLRQSDGSALYISYDSEGRATRLKDGEGRTTSYQYFSGKTLITDNSGQTTTLYYDSNGRLTGVDSPKNAPVRYEYKDNYLSAIHQGNLHWFFSYNEFGDCIRIEEPSGQVKTRIFDSEHRLLNEVSSASVSRYVYDEKGHLRFKLTADGSVTEYRYNQEGQCSSIRTYLHAAYQTEEQTPGLNDLLSWVSIQNPQKISLKTYHYDWRGLLDEEVIYYEIDESGNGINKKANRSHYLYDAAGRLLEKSQLTEKGWNTTTYLYDDLGRLIQRCDSQMHSEHFEYDDANHRIIETDARGLQRIRYLDRSGLELTTQYLDKHQVDLGTIHYSYDALGRLQSELSADGKATYYFYDAEGQLIAKCLPGGKLTEYRYDNLGRLRQTIQHQEALNTKTWQESIPDWSSLDIKTSQRDRISQIVYNDYNQIAYQIDAEGAVIAFVYNADGQVIKKTAYSKRLSHFQPTQLYFFEKIKLEVSLNDRSTYYFYDSLKRLQAEINGEGSATAYHYDREDHLLETIRYSKRLKLPPAATWVAPQSSKDDIHHFSIYNAAGLKIADIDALGFVTTYTYNEAGLLTQKRSLSTALSAKILAKINSESTLDSLFLQEKSSDHLSSYRYDDLGQLIEQREQNGLVTRYRYDEKGAILEKTLIDEKTKAQRQERFRYDSLGRLIQSLDALGAAKLEQSDTLSEEEIESIWQQHGLRFTYDLAGRLISRTNSLNQTTRYFYNEKGQLVYTLNANGGVTELEYNDFDQIELTYRYAKKIQGDLASLTQQELASRLSQLKDKKIDEFTHYEYNNLGFLIKKETGSKGKLTSTYNSFGEIEATSEQIDAKHQRLNRFSYDRRGLLIQQIDDFGRLNRDQGFEYDIFGRLVKEIDARKGTIQYYLNHRGERLVIQDQAMKRKIISYDAFGRILQETDSASKVINSYSYDDINNSLSLAHPGLKIKVETQFNAFGNKIALTDGKGLTTHFEYDTKGQLISTKAPEGSTKFYHYDSNGNLVLQEDGVGLKISYSYDSEGRLLQKIVDPEGLTLTTSYSYDALGRQLEIIEANGLRKQFSYDNAGNLIKSCIDPEGLNLLCYFHYDNRGLLIEKIESNPTGKNRVTAFEWDNLGRKIADTLDPNGLKLTTRYSYDLNNNLISQTDAKNQSRFFSYDAKNRCRYQIDARGVVTEHRYDINNNEIETRIYNNRITLPANFTEADITERIQSSELDHYQFRDFDSIGRMVSFFDAMGYATSYDYDANNNVVGIRRYAKACALAELKSGKRGLPDPTGERSRHFAYDGLNQLVYQVDEANYLTHFEYDDKGHVIAKTRYALALSTDNYSLTQIGLAIQVSPQLDQHTAYAYDRAGRLTYQANADGSVIGYTYDAVGNIIASQLFATRLNRAILESDNWQSKLDLSGQQRITRFVFDAAGRELYRISAEGRVMERRYDELGNVVAEISHGITLDSKTYSEQELSELLSADKNSRETDYSYDATSRLIQKTDANNQKTSYHYDENNNLTAKTEANSAQWLYVYDEENHLIEIRSPSVKVMNSGSGWLSKTQSIVTRNLYDSFGNLIALIRDAEGLQQTVYYVYDAKNLKTHTIYLNASVNAATYQASAIRQEQLQNLSEQLRYNAFGEVVASKDRANHWRYQAYDQKGQLAFSVDAKGTVQGYIYDAFGNLLSKTAFAKSLSSGQDYLYSTIAKDLIKDPCDRTETYFYDLNNRLIEVRQPAVISYNSKTRQYEKLCPTKTLTYNAFGDLTLIAVKRNETDLSKTSFYYDKDGLKTASLDAEHYLTTYRYNAFGELIDEIEFAERATSWDEEAVKTPKTTSQDRHKVYGYDNLGHLITKTLKNVSYQQLLNNSNRYETRVSDLTTRYSYDSMGNLTSTTDPLGNTSYYYYDDLNQLTTKIGPQRPAGRAVTSYNYDSLGQLIETIRHADGAKETDNHYLLSEESAKDIVTRTIFDNQGRVLTTIDGLNHEIHYSYDANGQVSRSWQLLSQNDGSKRLIDKRYSYDLEGHLLQTAVFKNNGQLKTEDASYNAFGELISKGIDGHLSTHYEYDNLGRVRRSNKQGFYQIYLYDLCNNLTQTLTSTNAFSKEYGYGGVDLSDSRFDNTESFDKDQWRYDLQRQDNEYDGLNRCIRQSNESALCGKEDLDRISSSQKVDRWGNILSHISARGFETLYEYNAFDQVVKQELPAQLILDEKFKQKTINPKLYYAYDALGRAIAITDAKGHTQAKILDAEGNCLEEIDALGNTRLKTYDLFGRLNSLQNELSGLTTYVYDKNNHLIQLKSSTGNQSYFYDEAGQLLEQRNALGQSQYYSYDNLDNLFQKANNKGLLASYAYDDAGHKIFEQDANGLSQSWEYDEQGHLLKHTDLGSHQTSYQYNKNGLLLEETSTKGKSLSYRYLGNGQLFSYSDNTYNEVAYYSYDAEGNITSKSVGRATQSKDNGWLKEIDVYTYDAQGRLTSLRRRHPDDEDNRQPEKDQALLSIDYYYDAAGNILLTEAEANYTGYQKIQANDFYSYDANNRMLINKGRLVNGELSIKDQGSQLTYDAAGNIKEAFKTENGQLQKYSYLYDEHSRLKGVYKNDSLLKLIAYDALSRIDKEFFYDSLGHATEIKVMTYEGDLLKWQVGYTQSFGFWYESEKTEYRYDKAGNLVDLINVQIKNKNTVLSTHHYEYDHWDNYIQIADTAALSINGSSPTWGQNTRYLDANGQFTRTVDSQVDGSGQSNSTEYKNSTLEGLRSRIDKKGQTNYLTVAGHTLGDLQLNLDGSQKLNIYGGFSPTGKFPNNSFFGRDDSNQLEKNDSILINTPQDNTGTYTVHAGDSLQSIAQQVYGDGSFWYLIADANGLTGSSNQLQNGQRLIIPAVATRQHHNASNHQVMSDVEFLGDISATLPLPSALMNGSATRKTSNSLFKKITITAVSVVATVLAAAVCATLGGAIGASLSGGLGSIFSLGMKVLSGKILGTLGSMAAGFSAGVAGNLTSQGLANLLGLQKGMNLRSALVTGLSTAASTGILQELSSSPVYRNIFGKFDKLSTPNLNFASAAQMLEQDAISQGVGLALEHHQHFNWTELGLKGALAAVTGSANAQKFTQSLTDNLGEGASSLIQSELTALAKTGVQSAINGEPFNALTVLSDNLGSALGNSFINAEVAAEEQELASQPDPETTLLEGDYCPIPEEETFSPIPEGTYERFHRELKEREIYKSIAEKAKGVWNDYSDEILTYAPKAIGIWNIRQPDKPEPFQWNPITRISGAFQSVGGGLELAAGAALTPVIPILGIPISMHGIDNIQTGGMQALTGEERETATYQLLRQAHVSETNARFIDMGISFIGTPLVAAEKSLAPVLSYAEKAYHARKEQVAISQLYLKGTLKSPEFTSQVGTVLLGGFSGAFGTFASGNDLKDVMFGFAAGAGISFVGGTLKILNNHIINATVSNVMGQTYSHFKDPVKNHFSWTSLGFSLVGSSVANSVSKTIDVAIVKTMINTLYTSPFNAVGNYLGEKKGWK